MNSRRGFTLIELLVVIAIIGILSSVVLASLNSARDKARYARVFSDLRQIALAAELDVVNSGMYPPDVNPGETAGLTGMMSWPKPPCTGWTYDWDNWWPQYGGYSNGKNSIRVTIRNPNMDAVYYYCIAAETSCAGGGGTDIRSVKTISCNQ